MIDAFGLVFILIALRSSLSVTAMRLRDLFFAATRPFVIVCSAAATDADWGTNLPARWHRSYFVFDRFATRGSAILLVLCFALFLARKVMASG